MLKKESGILMLLGSIWLLLWASYMPSLITTFPYHGVDEGIRLLSKEASNIPEFIKEEAGIENKSQKQLEFMIVKQLQIVWIKSVLVVFSGLVAGILMLKKKKSGYIIALVISAVFILRECWLFLKYWPYRLTLQYWSIYFKYFAFETVQELITIVVSLITVIVCPHIFRHSRKMKYSKIAI